MRHDADRYYTPPEVADRVAAAISGREVRVCVDASCGRGSLLDAAQRRFPEATMVGLDIDKSAVQHLRRQRPAWRVGVANILSPKSRRHCDALSGGLAPDVLVANPPFSMGPAKGLLWPHRDGHTRCSLAMAHILTGVEVFRPRLGVVAIVPHSFIHSELDATARELLSQAGTIEPIEVLPHTAFHGARAHSVLVRVGTRGRSTRADHVKGEATTAVSRGGLPVHEALSSRSGLPFVHSTALRYLCEGGSLSALPRVAAIGRGRVGGKALLIPRVGLPSRGHIDMIALSEEVQLSDCVIALRPPRRLAQRVVHTILGHWSEFLALYGGTGAKYLTVERVARWLALHSL